MVLAAGLAAMGFFQTASAYATPAATVDPTYQNYNSININDLKNVSLPALKTINLPTAIPTGSFNLVDFFHINLSSLTQNGFQGLLGGILSLVLNIVIAMAQVIIQIVQAILAYIK